MATDVTADRLERAIDQAQAMIETLTELQAEVAAIRELAPELLGIGEAAAMLEIRPESFWRLRKQGRIPAPIAELASGPVWLRAQFTWPNTLEEERA